MDEKLIGSLGGHFETGEDEQGRFIDYLANYDRIASQNIEFGINMLDLNEYIKTENIATRIIALGAKDEKTGKRLTVASVNNGLDYVEDISAIALFGVIEKTVYFDDVTNAQNLLKKAKQELLKTINATLSIELNAADMHNLNKKIESFRIGDNVRVISRPHLLDRYFLLSKLHIVLDSPSSWSMVLGAVFKSLTQKQLENERKFNSNVQNILGTAESVRSTVLVVQKTAEDAKIVADNTKTQVDNFLQDASYVSTSDFDSYKTEINQKIGSVYKICGSISSYEALIQLAGCEIGDVYNCLDNGANYVFTELGWDKLSETIDLSEYLKLVDAEKQFVNISVLADYVLQTELKDYLKAEDAEKKYVTIEDFEELVDRVETLENGGV